MQHDSTARTATGVSVILHARAFAANAGACVAATASGAVPPPQGEAAAAFWGPPGAAAPAIPLEAYVARVLKYAACTRAVACVALAYVDRACAGCAALASAAAAHRLFLAAVVVAHKFVEDEFYTNGHYARVGGVPASELARLELALLSATRCDLAVAPDVIEAYSRMIDTAYECYETSSAGAVAPHLHTDGAGAPDATERGGATVTLEHPPHHHRHHHHQHTQLPR
eukprot:TRINITY_DN4172_c0_g1_i2.p1 TRINITY_DN4172_c0_g1~~TRINITY_DN4172_c0_g1_i2.p1  ORF type:complete len:251 (+),score=71.19 TRINITY_DN4172_c0_g1_i2:75-755(+)